MLKHLKFSSIFHDDDLSVNVTLENPLDHGFTAEYLLFSMAVKTKNGNGNPLGMENFTVYIMDEANYMYNTQHTTLAGPNDEPEPKLEWMVFTEFKRDFMFQDLRIAVYYHPYQSISIINLNH